MFSEFQWSLPFAGQASRPRRAAACASYDRRIDSFAEASANSTASVCDAGLMNLGNYFRLRELIHGERASRSIVNKTTALWSIWTMAAYLSASISTHAASDKYFAFRLLDCRHRAR